MAMQPVTIFSMPKPFRGHINVIQRNAIGSWLQLKPRPEVILFGDEDGVAEYAAEVGAIHAPEVRRNEFGTPLMNDMFRLAHERASHEVLTYINADIVLLDDFLNAVERLVESELKQFLMIGRRIDTNIDQLLDFSNPQWRTALTERVTRDGELAPRVCKDYFVFRKPLFASIPSFAIGRAVYDNWFVYHAKQQRVPVVDATAVVKVVHQNHGYGHVAGGNRGQAYIHGEESKRNLAYAGGMRLIAGSTATWKLTQTALRRRFIPSDLWQFALDLPRFLRLVLELYGWIDGSFRRWEKSKEAADNATQSVMSHHASRARASGN